MFTSKKNYCHQMAFLLSNYTINKTVWVWHWTCGSYLSGDIVEVDILKHNPHSPTHFQGSPIRLSYLHNRLLLRLALHVWWKLYSVQYHFHKSVFSKLYILPFSIHHQKCCPLSHVYMTMFFLKILLTSGNDKSTIVLCTIIYHYHDDSLRANQTLVLRC